VAVPARGYAWPALGAAGNIKCRAVVRDLTEAPPPVQRQRGRFFDGDRDRLAGSARLLAQPFRECDAEATIAPPEGFKLLSDPFRSWLERPPQEQISFHPALWHCRDLGAM
jgi:hypothetical protein